MPDYQNQSVTAYVANLGADYEGKFNASGRAFPDVAAQGENLQVVDNGETGPVGGTSASTPIFASVVALLNDQLAAKGQKPLGFLNPWLYGPAKGALTDITSGSNPGCSTNGFPAKAGWDPVTGLGTPIFSKLLTAAGL